MKKLKFLTPDKVIKSMKLGGVSKELIAKFEAHIAEEPQNAPKAMRKLKKECSKFASSAFWSDISKQKTALFVKADFKALFQRDKSKVSYLQLDLNQFGNEKVEGVKREAKARVQKICLVENPKKKKELDFLLPRNFY